MKEIRSVPLNDFKAENENNEMRLSGYAAVFGQPTILFVDSNGTEYKEVIDRHAFDECDVSKCCLKYNHESAVPVLSRVRGGKMELLTDDYGLKFDAKLFNTQTARDVFALVQEGGLTECSFAFTLPTDGSGESYDKATHTRTILKIDKLWDCAVVDNPAYDGTSVAARDFLKAEAEKDNLERLEREAAKAERERKIKILNLMLEVDSE